MWFGTDELDFLITLYAPWFVVESEVNICAAIDHEAYHCGVALDEFESPKFRKDGNICFALRGHDVEEYVGGVRRWGVNAGAGKTRQLVEAANQKPLIVLADMAAMCGNCVR